LTLSEKTLKALEWEEVLKALSNFASTNMGHERCLNAEIFSDFERIQTEIKLTSEGKFLLDRALYPSFGGISSIEEYLELSKIGKTLSNNELIETANTIAASRRLKSFFARYKENIELIFQISEGLFENKELEEDILSKFDDLGNMLDNASVELKTLKVALRDKQSNLKNKLNSLLQSSNFAKYLQEPVYTIRDDRYVFPVKVEYKSQVEGIVHDSSASGATLFIEPKSIVQLNNAVKETQLEIDHEIQRILARLSGKVKIHADEIISALGILAELDFIFSKAKYAISLKAEEPSLNKKKIISIKGARHPILMKLIPDVVANDFEIGKEWQTLIITGSNTGGKTVFLKTIGLFVLMTKAGLHLPAFSADIYPFEKIFADIGDDQSIIQSLSTFSAHVANTVKIVNECDGKSLILIDEIGAGTDPSEGSALAEAILDYFHKSGAVSVVTTHLGELKTLAYSKTGYYNACVEFDTETLSPTYKLLLGLPGKSNATIIAQKLGLKEEIILQANELSHHRQDKTGEIIENLQNKQMELSKNAQTAQLFKEEVEKLKEEYEEKLEKVKEYKKKVINIFKKKFDTRLSEARLEIKEILEEIRNQKSETVARRALGKISKVEENLRDEVSKDEETVEPEFEEINPKSLKIGDIVIVKDLNREAEITALPDKDNNVKVMVGNLKTTVKVDKLAKSSKQQPKKQEVYTKTRRNFSFSRRDMSNTLDLRGMTADDGLNKLEFYLDEASLNNMPTVYIIHGHGTGVLREAVRDYLNTSPYVAKYRAGEQGEGGNGVSVVELK